MNEKILLVEDDIEIQNAMKFQLENNGYKVTAISSSGDDAVKNAKETNPDLILMDIKLNGGIDGIEASNRINQITDIPIIFLTAHCDEDIVEKAKKTSPYGYLVKPVLKRDLSIAIEIALYKHKFDKALKISEERYRAIVEDQTELICRFNKEGFLTFVNKAYANYFSKNSEELINTLFFPFLNIEDNYSINTHIESFKINNPVKMLERKIVFSDSNIKWQQWTDRAIFNGNGDIIEFQSVGFDITEKKFAQDELVSEKERLSVTLRSINDGVIATDMHGKIILINKVGENLLGYTQNEILGVYLNEVFYLKNQKSGESHVDPIENILKKASPIEINDNHILLDRYGNSKMISYSAAPIIKNNNEIIGVVLAFQDITEKCKMEEELQKIHKLESLGILAGGIAHDFNNIITGIMGNISLVMLELDKKDEKYQVLNEAERAVKQAKDLARQLLTFSKGGLPVRKPSNIKDLIKETASFSLRGSNVNCEFDFPDNIYTVDIDEHQMNQVISNLIMNANESMPDGGKMHIVLENIDLHDNKTIPLADGKYVRISIMDVGIGIHEKYLSKIFDPYFTTKQKGNGLGLAICYSIIKKHDGYITVDSKLGEGTTFILYLPASKNISNNTFQKSGNMKTKKNNEKILIMDDEDIVRIVIGKMLNHLGYRVSFSGNGTEAIAIYKKSMEDNDRFDAVIMDLTVPGEMGGEKAVKEIKKIDPDATVIVSSGYSNDPIMAHYRDYGFTDYIAKPYSIEDLNNVLRRVLK